MRKTLVLVTALAAVAGGCDRRPDVAAVRAPDTAPPAFAVGATLHLPAVPDVTLAAAAASAPHGWLAPVAVPSPDGRQVAYRTWTVRPDGVGRPALRVRDLNTGADTVLADGAASLAWGADGRIAYAAGGDDRPDARWSGRIVVRSGLGAPVVSWTADSRRYVVVAWAGARLLAYELDRSGRPTLFVLDGPGKRRALGSGVLVALAPDGERAFIADTGDTVTPHVRVVAVATGLSLARLDLPGIAVGHAGDWSATGRVVAAAWPSPLVFEVAPASIVVRATLRLDPVAYPFGLREPRFAGDTVIAWAAVDESQDPPTALIRCRVGTGGCTAGPVYPPPAAHPVTNPSRP